MLAILRLCILSPLMIMSSGSVRAVLPGARWWAASCSARLVLLSARVLVCLLSRRAVRLSILWSILLMAVLSRSRLHPSMWLRRARCGTSSHPLRDVKFVARTPALGCGPLSALCAHPVGEQANRDVWGVSQWPRETCLCATRSASTGSARSYGASS